jgi:hypothetical protein
LYILYNQKNIFQPIIIAADEAIIIVLFMEWEVKKKLVVLDTYEDAEILGYPWNFSCRLSFTEFVERASMK